MEGAPGVAHHRRTKETPMKMQTAHSLVRRKELNLDAEVPITVQLTHGEVWVTRERDRRDYILKPGDTLEHTGRGKTIILALEDSAVTFHAASQRAPGWTRHVQRLLRFCGA
jgi:hypothetical protein